MDPYLLKEGLIGNAAALAPGVGTAPVPPIGSESTDQNTVATSPIQLRLQEEFKLSNGNINNIYATQKPVVPQQPAQVVLNQQLPQLIASLKQQKDGTSESLAHLFT